MENKLLELIKTRRSCRRYRPVQIEDRELAAVLEAGTFAPTSMGRQDPWIVAVQRPDLLDRLARMNAEIMGSKGNPYYDAPTVVLVFAPADSRNAVQDASCVLENMMLAAHALGTDGCRRHIAGLPRRRAFALQAAQGGICPNSQIGGLCALSEGAGWAVRLAGGGVFSVRDG